jgi:hypothetical protein
MCPTVLVMFRVCNLLETPIKFGHIPNLSLNLGHPVLAESPGRLTESQAEDLSKTVCPHRVQSTGCQPGRHIHRLYITKNYVPSQQLMAKFDM